MELEVKEGQAVPGTSPTGWEGLQRLPGGSASAFMKCGGGSCKG